MVTLWRGRQPILSRIEGIDDARIQPSPGLATRASLETYSKIALGHAQDTYDAVIDKFPA